MRDATAFKMHSDSASRERLLFAQFEFLKTRQEAMEAVLSESSWTHRLKWAFYPADFWQVVDAVQTKLIADAQHQRKQEARKPKIEVVR